MFLNVSSSWMHSAVEVVVFILRMEVYYGKWCLW